MSQLVRDTAGVMQEFTQSGGVRPFGLSLLVAGYDDSGPQVCCRWVWLLVWVDGSMDGWM